jgi:CRP-like cAMP-binding protein
VSARIRPIERATSALEGNALLRGLPRGELESLPRRLDVVSLERDRFFLAASEPLSHVYFPVSGLMSLMVPVSKGRTVQAAGAGRDGMLGVSVVLEANDPPFEMVCLVTGEAVRMPADQFTHCARELPELQRRLLRYAHSLFSEVVRTAACNCLHPVEQRLARCLLLSRDRLGTDTLPITHDALAHMLGIPRALVTRIVNKLDRAGLVEHHRSIVRIVDSARLQGVVCEDYRVIQMHHARVRA